MTSMTHFTSQHRRGISRSPNIAIAANSSNSITPRSGRSRSSNSSRRYSHQGQVSAYSLSQFLHSDIVNSSSRNSLQRTRQRRPSSSVPCAFSVPSPPTCSHRSRRYPASTKRENTYRKQSQAQWSTSSSKQHRLALRRQLQDLHLSTLAHRPTPRLGRTPQGHDPAG